MLFYVFFLKFTIVYTGKLLCVNLELCQRLWLCTSGNYSKRTKIRWTNDEQKNYDLVVKSFGISCQLRPKKFNFKPQKLREEQFSWQMKMLHKIELFEYFF